MRTFMEVSNNFPVVYELLRTHVLFLQMAMSIIVTTGTSFPKPFSSSMDRLSFLKLDISDFPQACTRARTLKSEPGTEQSGARRKSCYCTSIVRLWWHTLIDPDAQISPLHLVSHSSGRLHRAQSALPRKLQPRSNRRDGRVGVHFPHLDASGPPLRARAVPPTLAGEAFPHHVPRAGRRHPHSHMCAFTLAPRRPPGVHSRANRPTLDPFSMPRVARTAWRLNGSSGITSHPLPPRNADVPLCNKVASSMSCVNVAGKLHLAADIQVECYGADHLPYYRQARTRKRSLIE